MMRAKVLQNAVHVVAAFLVSFALLLIVFVPLYRVLYWLAPGNGVEGPKGGADLIVPFFPLAFLVSWSMLAFYLHTKLKSRRLMSR